ncbi:MAG: hypothetical protein KDC47_04730 [Flavobacteriaceae bacterium]|nr:hypothetical protein [Flavobacteriaceae bacterium]
MYSFIDENGYINLKIDKADGRKNPITTFGNRPSAKSFLFSSVEKFELCQKLTGLYHTKQSCFNYTIQQCKGACIKKESTQEYNDRVNKLIEHNSFQDKSLLIIDRGREVNENSVVLIENGLFKGVGFFDLNYQINHIDVLQSLITPMENNRDIQHIIKSYLRSKKVKKVINLTT